MAHFARLDDTNHVVEVIKVGNDDILDENGVESEEIGKQVCQFHFPNTRWVQTSYNGNFRGEYAAKGKYFHEQLNIFCIGCPPEKRGYVYDPDQDEWVPPTPAPASGEGRQVKWNPENGSWYVLEFEKESDDQVWDTEAEAWMPPPSPEEEETPE